MKKLLLFAAALALCGATSAQAAGINLAWGAGCWADNPENTRTYACTGNTGTNSFTGSFMPTADQPAFVGIEVVVDLQADGADLPEWWQFFNSGSCRQTSLSTSADFTAAPGGCTDPWFGLAGGGIAAYQNTDFAPPPPAVLPSPLPTRSRLKVAYAVADPSPLTGGTEYYGFRATFNNLKTVGTGACPGCDVGVTIVLNEIKSAENTGPFERITNELTNRCITWQTSTVPCATVPTATRSWGMIKSLYR